LTVGIRIFCGALLLSAVLVNASERILPDGFAVSSAHPHATRAGIEILKTGGNAFDAAIAVASALAVVEPYSSGIGGGGFFLLHVAKNDSNIFIDARETAPKAASEGMYLDSTGKFLRRKSLTGGLAAAIPGLPAGLVYLSRNFGRLDLTNSMGAAIRLAKEGFLTGERYSAMADYRVKDLNIYPDSAGIFLDKGLAPKPGYRIFQPELARTLESIALTYGQDFYRGEVAERLVDGVRAAGGVWSLEDLADYRIKLRSPVTTIYRGSKIISAPPPSSGGVVLIEALNILERYNLPTETEIDKIHLVVEAMRRAYRDRADFLGDPDFVDIPLGKLLSKAHADNIAHNISIFKASLSSDLIPIDPKIEGRDTTHFSIVDSEGNRVAATLSINTPFGSGVVPKGTGVILNNEMDDFSARPLTPNTYGLVGAGANSIEPRKRPLSSMTPTFIESTDRIAILGTPGGSRIISMVLISALDFLHGGNAKSMVAAKRYHHQYLPDHINYEKGGFTQSEASGLLEKGHQLKESSRNYGNMHVVTWEKPSGKIEAASDERGEGWAIIAK
jgi:gamma-glutamyltranspeptidase / glutathione hydrolase